MRGRPSPPVRVGCEWQKERRWLRCGLHPLTGRWLTPQISVQRVNGINCVPLLVLKVGVLNFFFLPCPYFLSVFPSPSQRRTVLPLRASPTGSTAASPRTPSVQARLCSTPAGTATPSSGTPPLPAPPGERGAVPGPAVKVRLAPFIFPRALSSFLGLSLIPARGRDQRSHRQEEVRVPLWISHSVSSKDRLSGAVE